MPQWTLRRDRLVPTLVAVALIAGAATARSLIASDHQDTPQVELNPQFDINDVYAFPSQTPGRVVLVLGTSSPITPAQTPSFAFGDQSNELYQLKIDNTGDGVEDLVMQFTFRGPAGHQEWDMRGPVKPNRTGTANSLLATKPTLHGVVNKVVGSASGIQGFAGARDDPFFIDLEQFFRIIPDRRPVSGPLSQLPSTPSASAFRAPGQALDYVRGLNDMAIVIELPSSMLTREGAAGRFGVWGTTSKLRR